MAENKHNSYLVSIIVPALNEEKYIGMCLSSIKNLDYPTSLVEVIVVDNGSSDKTVQIAKEFGCRVEISPGITISALRNRGAEISRGDILAFLDADCTVNPDWIKNAFQRLFEKRVGIVGCTQFLLPHNASWVEKVWNSQIKKTEECVDWVGSGNLIIKRDIFNILNGFDESIATSEDCDLCFRLSKLGLVVYSTTSVSAVHLKCRKTIGEFFRKELWHGKGVLRTCLSRQYSFPGLKPLLFAFFYLFCLAGLLISMIVGAISNVYFPFFCIMLFMIVPPFVIAIKKSKDINIIFSLAVLYFVYGIARAIAILYKSNWFLKNKIL